MMKRSKVMRLGSSSIVLSLCIACAGRVHNLGDKENGGAGGSDTNGSTTGGKNTNHSTTDGTAYPLAPTMPIDPACTCSSNTQICNAANECVDRCDSSGNCAKWLTNSAVKSLFVEGTTLYYATAPKTDPVGNPGTNGSLYRVEYAEGSPTLLATGLQNPMEIIGRYNGATYLISSIGDAMNLYRGSDTGEVEKIDDCYNASVRGKWLAYTSSDAKTLKLIDLDGDRVPQVLVSLTETSADPAIKPQVLSPTVLDNYVSYFGPEPSRWCAISLANPAQGLTCSSTGRGDFNDTIVGSSGDTLFVSYGVVTPEYTATRVDGTNLLTLFSGYSNNEYRDAGSGQTVYSQGWLYTLLSVGEQPTWQKQLIRYPTTVGRLPQVVLSEGVTTPTLDLENVAFTVGELGVFWFQSLTDANQGQYIFHSPLPAQPCDAELPCADSATTCKSGFCTAP